MSSYTCVSTHWQAPSTHFDCFSVKSGVRVFLNAEVTFSASLRGKTPRDQRFCMGKTTSILRQRINHEEVRHMLRLLSVSHGQTKTATLLGFHARVVQFWLSGRKIPHPHSVAAICLLACLTPDAVGRLEKLRVRVRRGGVHRQKRAKVVDQPVNNPSDPLPVVSYEI